MVESDITVDCSVCFQDNESTKKTMVSKMASGLMPLDNVECNFTSLLHEDYMLRKVSQKKHPQSQALYTVLDLDL